VNENCNIRRSGGGSGAITLRDVATGRCCADYSVSNAQYAGAGFRGSVENGGDAAQRTGCVPNRMAGGLASSRSRLIAAVVPSTGMSVFMETVESLNNTLFDAGYQLMLGQSGTRLIARSHLLKP
jgi:LacI family gluconate utilization system Gnt-I transcriptional repressor